MVVAVGRKGLNVTPHGPPSAGVRKDSVMHDPSALLDHRQNIASPAKFTAATDAEQQPGFRRQ